MRRAARLKLGVPECHGKAVAGLQKGGGQQVDWRQGYGSVDGITVAALVKQPAVGFAVVVRQNPCQQTRRSTGRLPGRGLHAGYT